MRYAEHAVGGAAAAFVQSIWSLEADPGEGTEDAAPILPDGRVELLLNLGDAIDRHTATGRELQPLRHIAGQLTTAVRIAPRGRTNVTGIRLHPWAAGVFLGVPMCELRDQMLPADHIPFADRLLRAAGNVEHADARLLLMQDLLERHARSVRAPSPAAIALTCRLMAGTAPLTIRRLADSVGLGTRRVQAIFAGQVGIPPRTLARIARLQRALGAARQDPRRTLTAVAHDSGYFDHAHFVRDCRDIAGETPSELLGRTGGVTTAFLDGSAR